MVFCDFCERELTRMSSVYCEECKDSNICVRCFALGCENQKHKKNHPYRIITKLDFSLFDLDWTALEELL